MNVLAQVVTKLERHSEQACSNFVSSYILCALGRFILISLGQQSTDAEEARIYERFRAIARCNLCRTVIARGSGEKARSSGQQPPVFPQQRTVPCE